MTEENVLARRYATPDMTDIFSERGKILSERELWIAVMKAQHDAGVDISSETIAKYEAAKENIDVERIEQRERETRHDVKARIEAFVEAAQAPEAIHRGLTSRDLTENVEQMQSRKAANVIHGKYVSVLRHLLDRATQYSDVPLTARTHHQAAQLTTLGRRLSMYAEELHWHIEDFGRYIDEFPLRGIKGPVGTQYDMLALLGTQGKVDTLEQTIASMLGFQKTLTAPGQVYYRSLDEALLSRLACLTAPCANFAKGMRLMAGYDLVTEGFKKGQVGSSAMPHKMNTRTSERVCGLANIIKGHQDMASRISGDTWEEGDVSCSAPRRVYLADAFYASDGLCESALTILNEMGPYPGVLAAEANKYLPFLVSTDILGTLTKAGIGREAAHALVKKHSVGEALRMREGYSPLVLEKIADDPVCKDLGITLDSLRERSIDLLRLTGNARSQVDAVRTKAMPLLEKYAAQAAYEPRDIL